MVNFTYDEGDISEASINVVTKTFIVLYSLITIITITLLYRAIKSILK